MSSMVAKPSLFFDGATVGNFLEQSVPFYLGLFLHASSSRQMLRLKRMAVDYISLLLPVCVDDEISSSSDLNDAGVALLTSGGV